MKLLVLNLSFFFLLLYNRNFLTVYSFDRMTEKVNDRWEICVSLSDGQFQQV